MSAIRPYAMFLAAIVLWIVSIMLLVAAVVGTAFFFHRGFKTKSWRCFALAASCLALSGVIVYVLYWMITILHLT